MISWIRDLKSNGLVHQDLRPENVLLTRERHQIDWLWQGWYSIKSVESDTRDDESAESLESDLFWIGGISGSRFGRGRVSTLDNIRLPVIGGVGFLPTGTTTFEVRGRARVLLALKCYWRVRFSDICGLGFLTTGIHLLRGGAVYFFAGPRGGLGLLKRHVWRWELGLLRELGLLWRSL